MIDTFKAEKLANVLYSKHKGLLSLMLRDAFAAGQRYDHAPTDDAFESWLEKIAALDTNEET